MTEFSMDAVVALLRVVGRKAYVAQTGGGCSTIYAGESYIDAAGNPRHQILAGPGRYSWNADEDSLAITDDFYLGPDDDGESGDFDDARHLGVYPRWTIEAMLAVEIARWLDDFVWPAGAHQHLDHRTTDTAAGWTYDLSRADKAREQEARDLAGEQWPFYAIKDFADEV